MGAEKAHSQLKSQFFMAKKGGLRAEKSPFQHPNFLLQLGGTGKRW
jgi:hypothetical protein